MVSEAKKEPIILQRKANTGQIVRQMLKVARQHKNSKTVQAVADRAKTLQDVHNEAHKAAVYQVDPVGRQLIRTPERLKKDGVGNCVDYAVFISSVLQAKAIPHKIRVTSYEPGPFTHVYVIAQGKTLDPVAGQRQDGTETRLNRSAPLYDTEAPYYKKRDYPVMADVYLLQGPAPKSFAELQAEIGRIFDTSGSKCDNVFSLTGGSVRKAWRVVNRYIDAAVKRDSNALDNWINTTGNNPQTNPAALRDKISTFSLPLNQSQISVLRAMFDNEAKSITVANLFCNKQSRIDAALEYIDKKFTNYVPQTNDFYQYLVWSNSKYFSREFSLTVLRTTLPMALSALGLERFSNVFGAGSGTPPPPENEATINWLPLLAVGGGLLLFGFNNDEKPKK